MVWSAAQRFLEIVLYSETSKDDRTFISENLFDHICFFTAFAVMPKQIEFSIPDRFNQLYWVSL